MIRKPARPARTRALATACLLAFPAARADVSYTFEFGGNSAEENEVRHSVAVAAELYNRHGSFNKHWSVYHNPGIPTAEANYGGYMGYGGQRSIRVALHEAGHTVGMGTGPNYASLISGGVWRGRFARELAIEMGSEYADGLHGDGHAIWPWGMNFESEDGELDRIKHVRIMAAMRCDMGILAFNREAGHELVHPGGTAEFRVESPVATGYRWFRNDVALTDGGDISGATGPVLRIANAAVTDAGSYHCAATGAGETLDSRVRRLWVEPAGPLGQWGFEGDVNDASQGNDGTAFGAPGYVGGRVGQAIDLDGVDDYVELPTEVGRAKEMTVAAWVNWDGGGNWQRVFDFGTGTFQYVFLTPRSGGGTMRLALRDAVNGADAEQQLDVPVLPTGRWVHLAVVLRDHYATLYVDGRVAGTMTGLRIHPVDFAPDRNFIGASQYPDPLFNGRIDDLRIENVALDGYDLWELMGGSENRAPRFSPSMIDAPAATSSAVYEGGSLVEWASDSDGDPLSFTKIDGPDWLVVASDGSLSGMPGFADLGENRFSVRVEDPSGASSDAELAIQVGSPPPTGPVAYWDFADAAAADGDFLPGNGDRADLDGNGAMDFDDFRVGAVDRSGNGNHLTAWTSSWMRWTADSLQGDFGMTSANGFPASNTDSEFNPDLNGIDAEGIAPLAWTVEAIFKSSDLSGNRTIVGRDGRRVGGSSTDKAALYLSTRGSDLAIEFVDAAGTDHNLQVPVGLATGTWYRVAAASDGVTLRLFVDGEQVGSLTLTGEDPRLGLGYGTWSVARGMFADDHVDRFFGVIDAVAISNVALVPGTFVTETFGGDDIGYHFFMARHGLAGADFEDDANGNGIANGMEYYLGWDPTDPKAPAVPLYWEGAGSSVRYPYDPAATGVTGVIQWSTDLAIWSEEGVAYLADPEAGVMSATIDAADAGRVFVRLVVTP